MAAVSQEDVLLGLEKLFISENKISSRTLAKHHSGNVYKYLNI